MGDRSWTAILVVALLLLVETTTARELLYTGGSTSVKAAAFADGGNTLWTTGNGTWVSDTDRTVKFVSDFDGGSTLAGYLRTGVFGVTFPSKYLGVAVGAAPVSIATQPLRAGLSAQATVGALVFTQLVEVTSIPNILISVDGANSWSRISGIAEKTRTAVPDLYGVWCASRTLCWAVGGTVGGGGVATAAILMTTVGPGSWDYVLCPETFKSATSDNCLAGRYLSGGTSGSGIQTAIAALLAVTSDSAGRNVYAVGAQRSGSTPPIMYSSNSGLNWVMQVAPAISGTNYLLTSVTAATGKVVYAAGGDTATGAGVSGVILLTVNGGFSWLQQTLQWQYTAGGASSFASTANVGAFYGIAYNRNRAVDATVWAVGIRNINTPTGSPCYNIMRVYLPTGTASAAAYASFVTIPASALPASFGGCPTALDVQNLYGIVWDNPLHGWIYGFGVILVTQNGGASWIFETPNNLMVGGTNAVTGLANPTFVETMANVPSNY